MYHGIRIGKSKTLPFSDNAAEFFPWEPSTTGAKKVVYFFPYFMAYPEQEFLNNLWGQGTE
jgi:hypothetical protein